MGELPGRNVAKTGKGKNWKSRGRGKEKNMVVEYIPLYQDRGHSWDRQLTSATTEYEYEWYTIMLLRL